MKNIFFFFLITIVLTSCFTEEDDFKEEKESTETIIERNPTFLIEGKAIDVESQPVSEVSIIIKKDDTTIFNELSAINGKFNQHELAYGSKYTVTYSKVDYVTKTISIDTKTNCKLGDIENLSVFPIDITMLKAVPNINYDIISNSPVARIRIDTSTGGLDYDRLYISKRGEEISSFLETVKD